jgi:hypothetical protein
MVTARQAIEDFYQTERLPSDGGTDDNWVWVRAFGWPVPLPNIQARARLIPYHDLHHVVTGYRTDEAGEAEVAAWCLGTGGGPLLGQVYDLGAFLIGLVQFPIRTSVAFYRGRQCRNLYRSPANKWMDWSLADLRHHTHAGDAPGTLTPIDRLALARTILTAAILYAGLPAAIAVSFLWWM